VHVAPAIHLVAEIIAFGSIGVFLIWVLFFLDSSDRGDSDDDELRPTLI
jgi:hypothetical protein